MTNALEYHLWLVQKLNSIAIKDKAKADAARAAGDLTTAEAYDKFAQQATDSLAFVESWDLSAYNAILRKERKQTIIN
jgi:hypothetical protein